MAKIHIEIELDDTDFTVEELTNVLFIHPTMLLNQEIGYMAVNVIRIKKGAF